MSDTEQHPGRRAACAILTREAGLVPTDGTLATARLLGCADCGDRDVCAGGGILDQAGASPNPDAPGSDEPEEPPME